MKASQLLRLLPGCAALLFSPTAAAQCRTFTPHFSGPSDEISSVAVHDVGAGPSLFIASRRLISQAPAYTGRVLRWTGTSWETWFQTTPGPGSTPQYIHQLIAGDDGLGPMMALVEVHTIFTNPASRVWRFDGSSWTPIGDFTGRPRLSIVDDGNGPGLMAVGDFFQISGAPIQRVARWNGSSWSGYGNGPTLGTPRSVASFDSGSGMRLHVGTSVEIDTWNGSSWSAMPGFTSVASGLEVLDSGAGPRLYAGRIGGSQSLWSWNGASWSPIVGLNGGVAVTAVMNLGSGPRLFLAGSFSPFSVTPNVQSYDGSAFAPLGNGLPGEVLSLARWPTSGGTLLVAGGGFTAADNLGAHGLATWDGTRWAHLGGAGLDDRVSALCVQDSGSGPELIVGGSFRAAQGSPVMQSVARWNGSDWSPLGSGLNGVGLALLGHDDGSGPALYVAGQFTVSGGGPGQHVARWNGTSWSSLMSGVENAVNSLARFDEGAGEVLFAAGQFTSASGAAAEHIARWNGSAWSSVGPGLNGGVYALAPFGGELYAGGSFTAAGSVPVQNVARWNGTSWSDLPGGGSNGLIRAFHVHDDGRGPALYVGGGFSTIGGITAYNLARFDGSGWEAVDGGLDGSVRALASVDDDGDGDRELFVGGEFRNTASISSLYLARLEGCPRYESFCFGDGTLADHTTPCPCANDGAPGHGCANSNVPDGALLAASGGTNPDTLVFAGSGMPLTGFGIYLQHDATDDRVFHDGVICAGGSLIRLRNRSAVGGASTYPNSTDTQTVSQRGQVTPGSGATRYYSLFYRAASPTFCPPATANVTNGIRLVW